MGEDNVKSVDGSFSPYRGRQVMDDLPQGVIELPILEESLFDGHVTNVQGMRDNNFPCELLFSPMKRGYSTEISFLQKCEDMALPVQANFSAVNSTSSKLNQAVYQDVLSNVPSKGNDTKSKRKSRRTRKRRRGGNTSRSKRRKAGTNSNVPQSCDLTPRICTAPLCGTVHASVDDLRIHIKNRHPTMRMRC